jgi:hypothetical protein
MRRDDARGFIALRNVQRWEKTEDTDRKKLSRSHWGQRKLPVAHSGWKRVLS